MDNKNNYYPNVDKDLFFYMVTNSNHLICFPYIEYTKENNLYIDIYIWDNKLLEGYRRFVLEYGYSLHDEDEDVFLQYLKEDIIVEDTLFKKLIKKIEEAYPEIHLKRYADWRHSLLHIYYTFYRSGPYEILFKANLNHLAVELDCIDEYNLIGSSPEKIFDVQLGMLCALNSTVGLSLIKDVDGRKWARRLYSKFHNLIRGTMINRYQWGYLKELEECEGTLNKKMYRFLSKLSCDMQYYTYLKYMERKQIVDDYYDALPQFPEEDDLEDYADICDMIEWYIEHEAYINHRLKEKATKYGQDYCYETKDYIIYMPSSLDELLVEAQSQHNCLYKYVLKMAYGNTVILFMREKSKKDEALITIEIENGEILQALQAFNQEIGTGHQLFLKEYAKIKKLVVMTEDYIDYYDEDFD